MDGFHRACKEFRSHPEQAAKSDPTPIKTSLGHLQTRDSKSLSLPYSALLRFLSSLLSPSRPVHGKGHTEVASVCKFTLDPLSGALQEQEVFEELKALTQGFTRLGPSYELEEQSLLVEGESSWRDILGNSS